LCSFVCAHCQCKQDKNIRFFYKGKTFALVLDLCNSWYVKKETFVKISDFTLLPSSLRYNRSSDQEREGWQVPTVGSSRSWCRTPRSSAARGTCLRPSPSPRCHAPAPAATRHTLRENVFFYILHYHFFTGLSVKGNKLYFHLLFYWFVFTF